MIFQHVLSPRLTLKGRMQRLRGEGGSQRWTKATQLSNGGPAIGIQITFSLLLVNACVLWQRNYANTSLGNDTPYLGLFRDTMGNFVSPNDTFFFALKKKREKIQITPFLFV